MEKEVLISRALKFYELPEKLRIKIKSIALRTINGRQFSQDEIYIYISNLVDKFLIVPPYEERFFARLDYPRYQDSKTLESELIEIPGLFLENNKCVKERLKELKSKQNGSLRILGKPVLQIEPFIKLGRRKYNNENTPLDLYRKYPHVYAGKSRTQLFYLDAGMYETLRRWNQLKKAIPEIKDTKFKGISKKKENEIIETYKMIKSPTAIAKKLNISRGAIDRCLVERHKIRTPNNQAGNPGYSQKMITDVVECLKKCKKASKVAECYGINRFTVIKHGRKAGIPILHRGGDINNILKNKKPNPKTL
jgi:hypothetical protein